MRFVLIRCVSGHGALLAGRFDDVQKYVCQRGLLERDRAVDVCLRAAQTLLNAAASLADLDAIQNAHKWYAFT